MSDPVLDFEVDRMMREVDQYSRTYGEQPVRELCRIVRSFNVNRTLLLARIAELKGELVGARQLIANRNEEVDALNTRLRRAGSYLSPCCGKQCEPIYLGATTTKYRCPCGKVME